MQTYKYTIESRKGKNSTSYSFRFRVLEYQKVITDYSKTFERIEDAQRYLQITFVTVIPIVAFFLSLAPLALKRKEATPTRRSATFLLYFMLSQ